MSSVRDFRDVIPFAVVGRAGHATSSDGWSPKQDAHLGEQSQVGDFLGQT